MGRCADGTRGRRRPQSDDANGILNAVAAARKHGGGVVVLPAGLTFRSAPLTLANLSNVVLCVEGTLRAPEQVRFPSPRLRNSTLGCLAEARRYIRWTPTAPHRL